MAILNKASSLVIGLMEGFFYRWGKLVARRPYVVIIVSFIISALCCIGLVNIRFEADTNKMWIPKTSTYLPNGRWIGRNFGRGDGKRGHLIIFESKTNILKADHVKEMYKLSSKIDEIVAAGKFTYKDICYKLPIADIFLDKKRRRRRRRQAENQTSEYEEYDYSDYYDNRLEDSAEAQEYQEYQDSLAEDYVVDYNNFEGLQENNRYDKAQKDLSYSLPPSVFCNLIATLDSKCFESSLLEIWKYHKDTINRLTDDDILHAIHILRRSPYFGFGVNYDSKLGQAWRNATHVVGAKSALHSWVTSINFDDLKKNNVFKINIGAADRVGLAWELEVVRIVEEQNKEWKERGVDVEAFVNVARSFGDISNKAIFVDAFKMAGGYLLMFAYTTLMLGRLNLVELRLYLGATGLFSVLMGLGVAIGLMSAIGLPYIPLHAMLPFVCLGIGIDDMFVIVQCLHNLDPKKTAGLSLEERIGLTMKHAGVAITVTSLTDIFAFGVGAVTILPGLEAFCVSCAIGIGAIYLLQGSWFVAWLTLDQGRIEAKKNALVPCCYQHNEDWKPMECSRQERGQNFIKKAVNLLDYKVFKALVILITLGFAGVGLYGSLNMVIVFEPQKLLPDNTYLKSFIETHKNQFPKDGWSGDIYFGRMVPERDLERLDMLTKELRKLPSLYSVWGWFDEFKDFIREKHAIDDFRETIRYDDTGFNAKNFSFLVGEFVFSGRGGKHRRNLKFDGEVECNHVAPAILASRIQFTYIRFNGPMEHVPGKLSVEHTIRRFNVTDKSFSHSGIYAAWETDEVIGKELWRNLGLAMACVAAITLILLADISICFMVLICVVLTLLDLVGFLHFWDITIDTLSCVNIVLAVGLCVDYSAHIAHAFIVSSGSPTERAKNALVTMGPAIANGGITTFLALLFLGFSESHIFITFFKVFLLTVVFGLWHGLIFLATVLSVIGSKSSHPIEDSSNSTTKMGSIEAPPENNPRSSETESSDMSSSSPTSSATKGPDGQWKWPKRFNKTLTINN